LGWENRQAGDCLNDDCSKTRIRRSFIKCCSTLQRAFPIIITSLIAEAKSGQTAAKIISGHRTRKNQSFLTRKRKKDQSLYARNDGACRTNSIANATPIKKAFCGLSSNNSCGHGSLPTAGEARRRRPPDLCLNGISVKWNPEKKKEEKKKTFLPKLGENRKIINGRNSPRTQATKSNQIFCDLIRDG